MKAIVCGGRGFKRRDVVFETLDEINPHEIVVGGAPGADWFALKWAQEKTRVVHIYPAKWKIHGKAAGPIRNGEMLEHEKGVSLVIAFPGGPGTADMCRQAKMVGVEVRRIGWKEKTEDATVRLPLS